jgi:galactonate dehydratase
MRISAIETILHEDFPHSVHVRVHTDEGLTGLGESFHRPAAIAEYIHAEIAPRMLGEPAENVARMWLNIGNFTDGFQPFSGTVSIESSATSAFDIAMWDLRAKALGLPLHDALGGAVRDGIRVYNTSAGTGHLPPPGTPRHERHRHEDWGLSARFSSPHDDWTASLERPGELARELVSEGITAMKIYPFSRLIPVTRGLSITPRQLHENLEPFREIRAAVGHDIDIAVDLNFIWTAAPALQIATALDDFGLLWIEDPMRTSAVEAIARLAAQVRTPIAGFDYLNGLPAYARMIEAGALSIARMDLQWVGGVTEAVRIAGYADAKGLGVVLHDCTGPVQWAAAIHVSVHLRNAMIQESVRAFHRDVYPSMVERVPQVIDGHAFPIDAPGHGAVLRDSYLDGARRRVSTVRDGAYTVAEVTA